MKRFRSFSLVFLAVLLCAVQVSALADAPLGSAIARVDNPNPWDKLFLRSAPATESAPLGLYYNGTEVHVLDAASSPDWAMVRIGTLTGYMAKPFLAAGEAAQAVESMNPVVKVRATDGSGRLSLYERPDWNAPILDQLINGTGVTVLGVGPTWVHVFMDGQTGFMPVAGLSSVDEAAQAKLDGLAIDGPSDSGKTWLYAADIAISPSVPPATLAFWGSTNEWGTQQVDVAYLTREGRLLQAIPIGTQIESAAALSALIVFEDVNFDGFLDFRISRSMGGYNPYYNYWTYDPFKNAYASNRAFDELEANPSFDAASGQIFCDAKDGAAQYYEFTYTLEYGLPVMTEKRDILYKDQHNRTVTLWQRRNGELVHVGTRNERVD